MSNIYKGVKKALLSIVVGLLLISCGGGGGSTPQSFTVSGTILPVSGSRIDSDVNDPNYSYAINNSIAQAQPIPNPLTLGGYVNLNPTGVSGDRFALMSDQMDFFGVQLAAGQIITLTVVNADMDLDLYLYDQSNNPVATSLSGIGSNESITVPGSFTGTQDFTIEVRAFGGQNSANASRYILSIGLSSQVANQNEFDIQQEFVPGELIIEFNEAGAGILQTAQSRAASVGMQQSAGAPGRAMLMKLPEKVSQLARMPTGVAMSGKQNRKIETLLKLKSLKGRADVKQARLNYIYKPLVTPNDTHYPVQWHYPLIRLPQAWDVTTGDSNVIVAVIDTGVLIAHPDFAGKLVQGYDFISDPQVAADGNTTIDSNPNDPGDRLFGATSSFHGTHVAGTIGAATNNGVGVAGVGWNTSIMPLRALGVGGGTSYDIEQAVRYAARLSNDSGTLPTQQAHIINLSLGGPGGSPQTPTAYAQARAAGVIIIAAAGNDSSNEPFYPAAYDGVVSVSAVNLNRELAYYSNFGATIDVTGPGGDAAQNINGDIYPDGIMSTVGDDSVNPLLQTYGIKQGTSMSAPHVSGVVALMKSIYPAMTPAEFDTALQSGAITEDLGAPNRDDQFGYGLIDALSAVLTAQTLAGGGMLPDNPFMSVSPGSLNFGNAGTTTTINVSNAGTGSLIVDSNDPNAITEDSGGWLTVTPQSVDAEGLGLYDVVVDRSNLVDGTYTANITIVSNVNTVIIPVIMQIVSVGAFDDAGLQYVLLYDPVQGSVVRQDVAVAVDGSYSFSFNGIAANDYQIFTGTDVDNNGFICESGESCGFYPNDSPNQTSFTVNDNISNINLITGFIGGVNVNTQSLEVPGKKLLKQIAR